MARWNLATHLVPVEQGFGGSATQVGRSTTNVTSGSANSKGSWTSLAPTGGVTYACEEFLLFHANNSTANTAMTTLVDVGISSDGTTFTTVLSNLTIGSNLGVLGAGTTPASGSMNPPIYIPATVPVGYRVGVRTQSVTASKVLGFGFVGYGRDMYSGASFGDLNPVETYGADTANSRGTTIAPNASATTFGNWTSITASTTYPHAGFIIGVGLNGSASATPASTYRIQIGDGTNIYYDGIQVAMTTGEAVQFYNPPGHYCALNGVLPAGSSVQVRCDGSSASSVSLDVTLHGLRK